MIRPQNTLRALLAGLFAVGLIAPWAAAQDTWAGNTSTAWGTGGNWLPSGVPANTATAFFSSNGTFAPSLAANETVGELVLENSFSNAIGGGTSFALTIGGTGTGTFTGILNTSANTITFNVDLTVGTNAQTWQTSGAGGLIFSDAINMAKAITFDPSASGMITVNGVISGAGAAASLIQNGTGTTVLTATNTYSGTTTIASGTLQLGTGTQTTASMSTGAVTDNGALVYDLTGLVTAAGAVISGSGTLTQTGNGTLVLNHANTYTGATSVTAGQLTVGIANGIGSSSDVNVTGGQVSLGAFNDTVGSISSSNTGTISVGTAVLTAGGDNKTTTFAGILAGTTGDLVKSGSGTLVLTGTASYTGATSVIAGGLQIGNGPSASTGSIASASLVDNAAVIFDLTSNATVASNVTGSGTLIQEGTGTLILTGTNSAYAGTVSINQGALQIGNVGANGNTGTANITDNGALTYDLTGLATAGGTISGSGTLTQTGNGTLVLVKANTYSGATSVTGGQLTVGIANAIGSSSDVNVTGGQISLGAFNDTVGSISSSNTGTISVGTAVLTAGGDNKTTTFAGVLAGTTGDLVKSGSGTLVLTGTASYTGATSVTAGGLQIGNGASASTGSIASASLVDNAAVIYDLTSNATVASNITGNGTLIQEGTGTLILTGTNSAYAGTVSINQGALQIGNVSANGNTGTANITDNGALTYDLTGIATAGGTISGSGTLTQAGNGTLVLVKANTYSGATSVTGGQLTVGIANAIGSSSDVNVTGGQISLGAFNDTVGSISSSNTGTISLGTGTLATADSNSTTFAGVITGSGATSLIQGGSGTLVLTGANTYTGATDVTAGTLQIGNGASASTGSIASTSLVDNAAVIYDLTSNATVTANLSGTSSGNFTQSGTGTLILTGANTNYAGVVSVGQGTLQIGNATANGNVGNGNIKDNGALAYNLTALATAAGTISGSGSLTQASSTGTLILNQANTYTGATSVVNGGTLTVGVANAIGSSSDVTVNGSTLNLNGLNDAVGSIAGNGTGTISLGSGTLTVSDGQSTNFAGVISGAGGLTVNGSGTLQLTGTDTYGGVTSIASGALQLGNGGAGGAIPNTSSITDNASLIFDLSSNLTLPGTLSGSGSVTQAGSGTLFIAGAASYTGATTIGGNGTLQIGTGGATGSFASTSVADNGALIFDLSTNPAVSIGISGSGSLTQAGSGTLVLTGTNTYAGATDIIGGALQLGNGGSTGSIAYSTSILDNSSLVVDLASTSTISAAITGSGTLTQAGSGTLVLTGASSYTGATTIKSATTLELGGTNSSLTGNITDSGTLIFGESGSGSASGVISGAGHLVQSGTGTTLLTNANTYTGSTTVTAGQLQITNPGALGTATFGYVASGATLAVSGNSLVTAPPSNLYLNSNGGGSNATLASVGGNNAWGGNIIVGNTAGNATISETAGGIFYIGNGYLSTSSYYNSQLYTGATTGNTLTLSATAANPTQDPTWELNPNSNGLGGSSTVGGAYVYAPTNILIQSKVYGSGNINVTGAGTVELIAPTQSNSYTGSTQVTSGTLIADGGAGYTVIPSSSVIVGASGGSSSAVLQLGQTAEAGSAPANGPVAQNFMIGSYNSGNGLAGTSMMIYQNGAYDMNSSNEYVANLTMQGGLINEGNPLANTLLTVTGTSTNGTNQVTTLPSSSEAVITNGNFGMGANNFTFNVGQGSTTSGFDLEIFSTLENPSGYTGGSSADGLTKTGAGTLMLQGNNGYAGITDIANGTLVIQSSSALGLYIAGSTDDGTVVEGTAQLQVQQNPGSGGLVVPETVTLNGNGTTTATGALYNENGNNTWTGSVYLNSAATIEANAGSSIQIGTNNGATIINGLSSGQALTFGNNNGTTSGGLITVDGAVSTNIGNLTQSGSGTTVLEGSDHYTGNTLVTNGALRLTNNNSIWGTGVSVSSGGTLQLAQDQNNNNINENNLATTINGSGNGGSNGAIENVIGNNTYNGAVTLASNAQVNADSNSGTPSNLTFSNTSTINNGGNTLTVGGTGNTTFNAPISGSGGLVVSTSTATGGGIVTLNAPTTSSPANSYAGVTSVASGTLSMGGNNQIGTGNALAIASGGTVMLNATTQSIKSFTGQGTLAFGGTGTNPALSSTMTINSLNDVFNGVFTGAGTLYIPANTSLILGQSQTALIDHNGVYYNFYDTSLNIVLDGGTLYVDGTNDVFGTLTVEANSTLDFTLNGATTSTIDFTGVGGSGGVTIPNTSTVLTVSNWADTKDYFYSTNQPGVRFQMPLDQIVFDTPTWVGDNTTWLTYADGPSSGEDDHQITPVPEPGVTGAMVAGAALALAAGYSLYRRRGTRNQPAPASNTAA